jgi:ABC-type phosphate/phosphonate transport system substrate-binding protein
MNIGEAVTYIKEKIKNRLPEYTETFVDGKPYRMDVLQLETRWTKKTAEAIETLLTAYEKEKEKNKEAIDFINDKNNYFEDGENWQKILKIKEILEE